jgi:hypothetical protein
MSDDRIIFCKIVNKIYLDNKNHNLNYFHI